MSANNVITIDRKTFVVKEVDAETGHGIVLGKAKSLGDAIDVAEKGIETGDVEYGIRFIKNRGKVEI